MSLISAVKHRSRRAVRRAAFQGVGGLFILIGFGFLSVAGWILLEDAYSALVAAFILAAAFLGVGLIIIGLNGAPAEHAPPHPSEAELHDPATRTREGELSPLAQAFVIGLNAAAATRGRRR